MRNSHPATGDRKYRLENVGDGERGRLGLGIGAIGRSSPYVGSSKTVTQVIPAVTYVF